MTSPLAVPGELTDSVGDVPLCASNLLEQRARARRVFEEHRERLRQLQALLVAHLQQASLQLSADRRVLNERETDFTRQKMELEQRRLEVELLQQLHWEQRDAWEKRLHENDARLEEMLGQLRCQLEDIQQKRARLAVDEGRLRQWEQELEQRGASEPTGQASPTPAETRGTSSPERPAQKPIEPGKLNWESMKQQLLADLEQEGRAASGSTISQQQFDEWMRQTDTIVAEKDRQILELQDLLQSQSANIGQFAVGAAAVADLLDQDLLIREERESLRMMQEEWHEKLRRAELEISMERAKIARERVELEEKTRRLESERAAMTPSAEDAASGKGKSPQRGRWMTRLGLNGGE